MDQILKNMRRRYQASLESREKKVPYSPTEYEQDVHQVLSGLFPFSVLSGLRLFSAANRQKFELGIEIDNLMHFRLGGTDYIVLVESKKQEIEARGDRWVTNYGGEEKCARRQVESHIRVLWEYLEPISKDIDLKFVAIVASASRNTLSAQRSGYRNSELRLITIDELPGLLAERFHFGKDKKEPAAEVLRVAQSGFLDLLRLSLPVPELGHPELASAIGYVERCRRTLDESLFQDFSPTSERWVINGSAGMGKSVLLAYTAAVLCSGYELYTFQGETGVKKADDTFKRIGFNADHKAGGVSVMAMSQKQLENVREWIASFERKFLESDASGELRFRQPEYILCRDGQTVERVAKRSRAILIDEAHDLPAYAAREIARFHGDKGFYLVLACDRHQKLRLVGSDAKILDGLDFTNKSTRLKQIYRNPAPVYIASLALMFRWFAEDGPKVLPSATDLKTNFGFEPETEGDGYHLALMSDAHPANSWCHTVAEFPSAQAAFSALTRERVERRDVLWVRFCEEDQDFDYEQVAKTCNYHNCLIEDAHKISNKYVKGQDFPIVVIEGFPDYMDSYRQEGAKPGNEERMWMFRRELYLCASRATCFLYFICNAGEAEDAVLRVKGEIARLVAAISLPTNPNSGGAKSWSIHVTESKERRTMDVFADFVPPAVSPPEVEIPVAEEIHPAPAESRAGLENVLNRVREVVESLPTSENAQPMEPENSHPSAADSSEPPASKTDRQTNRETQPAKIVRVRFPISLKAFAEAMGKQPWGVIGDLKRIGVPVTNKNESLEQDVAAKICEHYGFVLQSESWVTVRLRPPFIVKEVAAAIGVKPFVVIKDLMDLGVFANQNQQLDLGSAAKVCEIHGFNFESEGPVEPIVPSESWVPTELRSLIKIKPVNPSTGFIVKRIAAAIGVGSFELVRDLINNMGVVVNENGEVTAEIAEKLCRKRGFTLESAGLRETPPLPANPSTQEEGGTHSSPSEGSRNKSHFHARMTVLDLARALEVELHEIAVEAERCGVRAVVGGTLLEGRIIGAIAEKFGYELVNNEETAPEK